VRKNITFVCRYVTYVPPAKVASNVLCVPLCASISVNMHTSTQASTVHPPRLEAHGNILHCHRLSNNFLTVVMIDEKRRLWPVYIKAFLANHYSERCIFKKIKLVQNYVINGYRWASKNIAFYHAYLRGLPPLDK
jgi:hypothetical protein